MVFEEKLRNSVVHPWNESSCTSGGVVPYNADPREVVRLEYFTRITGDEPMKRAIRISVLMVGLVGTFLVATAPQVPAADGGPILVCPPGDKHCQVNLPLINS